MGRNWREKVANGVASNPVTRDMWHNIGQFQYSAGRMANFALGTLYGTGLNGIDITRRVAEVMRHHGLQENKEVGTAIIAVARFLGTSLNSYLGSQSVDDYLSKPSHFGGEPSPMVLEALTHQQSKYSGGIDYPATLDLLEQYGIMSKEDFFKFANMQAVCDEKIAQYAIQLEGLSDVANRAEIRDRMVEANCDSVGTILCAVAHIFKPNPGISNSENLTLDGLREHYPMQMEIGRAWQSSYSTVACVNRISREQQGETTQPDPVIAELERAGNYTPELIEEICQLAHKHEGDKAIPTKELPAALQEAIQVVAGRTEENIKQIPNASRIRKAIYNGINTFNSGISVCNQAASSYFNNSPEHKGHSR